MLRSPTQPGPNPLCLSAQLHLSYHRHVGDQAFCSNVQEKLGNIASRCSQCHCLPCILILKSSCKSTNKAPLPSMCHALLSAPRCKEEDEEDLCLSKLILQLSQEKQGISHNNCGVKCPQQHARELSEGEGEESGELLMTVIRKGHCP